MPMPKSCAPVCGLAAMRQLNEEVVMGEYHLLLAHLILEDQNGWERFFHGIRRLQHRDPFLIMDNSLVELDRPMDILAVIDAAHVVGAQVIVLPDILGNMQKTVALSGQASEAARGQKLPAGCQLAGVVQGKSMDQCIACARSLITMGVGMLMIPRILTQLLGTRFLITQAIGDMGRPVHLLGFSNSLLDDIASVRSHPMVSGIDSACPLWLGCQMRDINDIVTNPAGSRPQDFLNRSEPLPPMAINNLLKFRRWINDPEGV